MTSIGTIAFGLIIVSLAIQIVFLFKRRARAEFVSSWLLLGAAVLLGAVIGERSLRIRFFALTGTYESLIFYAATVALVAFVYRMQKRIPFIPLIQFGAGMIAVLLLAVASSPIAPKEALAPIPALRSSWLILHVSFSFIGEAFFVASFVAALAFLFSKSEERRLAYDKITYTAIAVGYPIFTAGALIFGAIWAEQAWGAWWSWDPKETWALVTWLVYTFYLHLRLIVRRKDRLPSLVAVIGFLCTVFTFFGVNYLLPGLHSYG